MTFSPDFKPIRAARIDDPDARLDFKIAVLAADGRCVAHDDIGDCDGVLQAHHCITQGQLRRAGREDLLWEPKNGAAVCERAHRRHHSGRERIALDRLPQRCIDFAREYGFEAVLDRFYAGRLP